MRRGSIFHLFSRIVYGQIEKENLRNRKKHSFDFMRARLVLLDFILANQELAYFETEKDKVHFFCEELGISKDCLPAKVYEGRPHSKPTLRYFIDKFPLFLAPPFPGAPPVVTMTYVDSGFETPSSGVLSGTLPRAQEFQIPIYASGSAQRDAVNLLGDQLFPNVPKLEEGGNTAQEKPQQLQ
jgi:hypothetical protein